MPEELREPLAFPFPLLAAITMAGVHLAGGAWHGPRVGSRRAWLSGAGGISVAYVFVQLLPELASVQQAVDAEASGFWRYLEDHAYLLAVAGLALYYGVEETSRTSKRRDAGEERATGAGAFALSVGSFAVYNAIIGYLLVHGESSTGEGLALFTVAIGVHMVVNDHSLREHHRRAYHRVGRWILAAAVLAGWGVGRLTEISEAALGLPLAFIAGGVVLNVLKEEVPDEQQASVSAFAAGAVAYAALLQAV